MKTNTYETISCDYCSRTWTREAGSKYYTRVYYTTDGNCEEKETVEETLEDIKKHEANCSRNPKVKTCKTCDKWRYGSGCKLKINGDESRKNCRGWELLKI